MKKLSFQPFWGLSSHHLQMILAVFLPQRKLFASSQQLIDVGNGDKLSCEVSTPLKWKQTNNTTVLIHGLGGSHSSGYMIRIARKLYKKGNKVVRLNLRNCGSGIGLSKLPYSAGNSEDVFKVLQTLKKNTPASEISLVGFSLGANTALKLAGELGAEADKFLNSVIAICPPFDLEHSVHLIEQKKFYLRYYLKKIYKQSLPWTTQKFQSLYEFDDKITGPAWGYSGAMQYYQKCSSKHFLNKICIPSHILCAEDDPFVSIDQLDGISLPANIQLCVTKYGSHMGFLGRDKFRWLDHWILTRD